MFSRKINLSRRSFFQKLSSGAAVIGLGSLVTNNELDAVSGRVNTNSQPSNLKITDMRLVTVGGHHILRLDTNQGISGYGELYLGSSKTYALLLKSRLLGMNPCNVDQIFRKIKQFAFHARQGAGVSSIEMALWDLAGKAWNVPVWQMLGGKFRDKVRVYADTTMEVDPVKMGNKLKERMNRGCTFLKMDVSVTILNGIEGTLTYPKGQRVDPFKHNPWDAITPHPFTGVRITEKGLKILQEYVAAVREIVGWEIPIATDHYGHFAIEDGIKLAQALDKFNLAWLEDMVPWFYTDQYVRLRNSCTTPILTGEDINSKEGFKELFEKQAIAICHPDIAVAGGILEVKKIGDLAMEHGIAMAMHMAGSAIMMFPAVHCASATENFLCMEHHGLDDEWYDKLVDGVPKPLMDKEGFIAVPDGPGMGIELNEEVVKSMLKDPKKEFFPPTDEWNDEKSHDRLWSISNIDTYDVINS